VHRPIDWRALAEKLGTITLTEHGRQESGGTKIARDAIAELIGEDALRAAVDFYVSGAPGFETAKSVLELLKPPAAMDRCHEIFLASSDEDAVNLAINLLQHIADQRVLERVPLYLASESLGARHWGIGIVDYLVTFGGTDLEDAMPVLTTALAHDDPCIRERAQDIIDEAHRAEALARG